MAKVKLHTIWALVASSDIKNTRTIADPDRLVFWRPWVKPLTLTLQTAGSNKPLLPRHPSVYHSTEGKITFYMFAVHQES